MKTNRGGKERLSRSSSTEKKKKKKEKSKIDQKDQKVRLLDYQIIAQLLIWGLDFMQFTEAAVLKATSSSILKHEVG